MEEIRVRDDTGAYRVVCIARRPEAVYVRHALQMKAERTAELDIELARLRFSLLNCGPTQPRVNDLLRGRISRFSLDALVNIASALGLQVRLKVSVA